MFRGDALHTGFYDTKGIPQKPKNLWQFRTEGDVAGTPVYADGMVYFDSLNGHFYAVDAETGIVKWDFNTGTSEEVHSAPAVAMGTVYFGSLDGHFYALDALTGKERWTFDAGTRVWSSPTWAGGVVYFGVDNGTVYGLNGESGREVWHFQVPSGMDNSVWGPPSVDEATGTIYIPSRDGNLYAVDLKSATEKWHFETGEIILGAPAVGDGVVVFCNWTSATYAVDAASGKLAWKMERVGSHDGSVAVHGGVAYIGDESKHQMVAVDARNGNVLWQTDLGNDEQGELTAPVIAGGLVYITSTFGGVYGVELQSGKLAWSYRSSFQLTAPAIWNGTLYYGSASAKVFAIR